MAQKGGTRFNRNAVEHPTNSIHTGGSGARLAIRHALLSRLRRMEYFLASAENNSIKIKNQLRRLVNMRSTACFCIEPLLDASYHFWFQHKQNEYQ